MISLMGEKLLRGGRIFEAGGDAGNDWLQELRVFCNLLK